MGFYFAFLILVVIIPGLATMAFAGHQYEPYQMATSPASSGRSY